MTLEELAAVKIVEGLALQACSMMEGAINDTLEIAVEAKQRLYVIITNEHGIPERTEITHKGQISFGLTPRE